MNSSRIICIICFEELNQLKKGTLENCTHEFCLKCITDWSKEKNSCPICRTKFTKINGKTIADGKWNVLNYINEIRDEISREIEREILEYHELSIDDDHDYANSFDESDDNLFLDELHDILNSSEDTIDETDCDDLISSDSEILDHLDEIIFGTNQEENSSNEAEQIPFHLYEGWFSDSDQEENTIIQSVGVHSDSDQSTSDMEVEESVLTVNENNHCSVVELTNTDQYSSDMELEGSVLTVNENNQCSVVELTDTGDFNDSEYDLEYDEDIDEEVDELNENIFYASDDEIMEELLNDDFDDDY